MSKNSWNTRFTNSFKCRLPILGAPMAGVSGGALAFETCRAGGMGFIAAGHLINDKSLESLEREIKIFRDLVSSFSVEYPLSIGFIGHSTFGRNSPGWDYVRRILQEYRPASVQIFAPAISKDVPTDLDTSTISILNNVEMCQSYGCQVIAQVGSIRGAMEAMEAGVDCLIAQGNEAGGHGIRRELGNGTLSLTARLVHLVREQNRKIPVLAAGGIVDGRGLAAALSLGADGAVLGTRLWASREALGPSSYKDAIASAKSCDDVVRTRVFDTICNSNRPDITKWPYPFDSSGTLRNETTESWDTRIPELEAALLGGSGGLSIVEKLNRAEKEENASEGCVYCGQGVGEIHSVDPVFDIVQRVEQEAIQSLSNLVNVMPR